MIIERIYDEIVAQLVEQGFSINNDRENARQFLSLYHTVWYCPTCQVRLDKHPTDVARLSCYYHGDFVFSFVEGKWMLLWKPTVKLFNDKR